MREVEDRRNGFSLVEVVLALGLLGGVLIAISSMFVIGGREVKSGKQTTEALSITQDIMEEIKTFSYQATYTFFGGSAADTGLQADSRSPGDPAEKWQGDIEPKLHQGRALIDITPIGGPDSPPQFGSADYIRVRVTVQWNQGPRGRSVSLQSLRF